MPTTSLPIIDMATYRAGAPDAKARLLGEIAAVSRELGFFYLVNHGLPEDFLARQLAWARRFFSLPLDQKLAVDLRHSPVRRGYEPMALQTLQAGMPPDQKEGFSIGCEPPDGEPLPDPLPDFEGRNQWPADHAGFDAAGFRAQMEAYRAAMIDLGREICGLIAASLGLAEDYFADALAHPNATLRLLHYPPLSEEAALRMLGCGAHTDWGFITLLLQDDCGGLEIETASGGWLKATPVPGAMIVNLGDMGVRMTGGRYASNVHRVLHTSPDRDRYSVATFFNPHADYTVDYVPTCAPEPGRLPPTTFADHIHAMVAKTYAAA